MLVINGIPWRIIMVSPHYYKLFRRDGSLSIAVCDNEDKAIYINSQVQGNLLKRVLNHEITHAFIFSYNLNNLTEREEEMVSNIIAFFGEEIIFVADRAFNELTKNREEY